MDVIKLVKLACGKHWGLPDKHNINDSCNKCKMHAKDAHLLQNNGVPWAALLGQKWKKTYKVTFKNGISSLLVSYHKVY